MSVRIPDFYIFPQFGGPSLSAQYPNLRNSFGWLNAVMRNSYIDESTNITTHSLNALAYGELLQRFKFRWRYDASNDEFQLQQNTTDNEANPTWTTLIKVRESDGRVTITGTGGLLVTGGFYNFGGLDVAVTQAGGAAFGDIGTLLFNSNDGFYLTPDSSGRPIVNVNTAAASGTITTISNEGSGSQIFIQKVGSTAQLRSLVAGTNVTLQQNASDITISSSDTGEVNTASNLGSGFGIWFDKQGVDLRFKSLVGGPGVNLSATSTEITIAAPEFYTQFKESEAGGYRKRDHTISFDSSAFYVSSGGDSHPLVSLKGNISLDQLNMDGPISFLEISEPATPDASHLALWAQDSQGFSQLLMKTSNANVIDLTRDNLLIVRNVTGSTIGAGVPVYVSGATGSVPQVSPARADSAATMPAIGVTRAAISNNSFGRIMIVGQLSGIDLSSFSDGNTLWVSPSVAGTFVTTQPTHPNLHQQVGTVLNASNNGTLLVSINHTDGEDPGTNTSTFTLGASTATSIVLTPSSTSQRTVTFQDRSGTVAYVNDVGPGFYGIVFRESESGGYVRKDDQVTFDSAFFYVVDDNRGKPLVTMKDFSDIQTFANSTRRDNALINGNFDIWQRGTTFTEIDNFKYSADRWQTFYIGSTGVDGITISRSTSVPTTGTSTSAFSFQATVATADASIGADEVYAIAQPIEGANIQQFGFGTGDATDLTLSFWVNSSLTGTYCVFFRNAQATSNASARTYVVEYTVSQANTWQYKTISLRADAGGTYTLTNSTGAFGILVGFALAVGSSFQTSTTGAWHDATAFGTANQTNFMGTVANTINFARVQLEYGRLATPFAHRHIGLELQLCQRYYAKTFAQSTTPADGLGGSGFLIGKGNTTVAFEPFTTWSLPAVMRAAPTVQLFNRRVGGAPGQWQIGPSGDGANARVVSSSPTVIVIDNTAVTLTSNLQAFIGATADAEL